MSKKQVEREILGDPYSDARYFADRYGVGEDAVLRALRWEADDIAAEDERDKRGSRRRRKQYHELYREAADRMDRWFQPESDPGAYLPVPPACCDPIARFVQSNRPARVWVAFAARAARAEKVRHRNRANNARAVRAARGAP